ncbi:glycosyltransferase family protein [Paenarthrobacter sp. 22069]|uniref:glycosyltransferase family protein n=1 Tax=Paenarthrobacter sp. 22069 TaxID=3453864 RepID=UPI003F8722C0
MVFTVGNGDFRSNFLRTGSTDVRWCSSVYDPTRFGHIAIPTDASRRYDVVVIANKTQARSPFTGHPNARQRVELVHRLAERFGPRFAVYGKGWTGPSAQGPVDYSFQHKAIHSGWITANWDHYAKEEAYFSDRLPTTLATGSVHATTLHDGFEQIFPRTRDFLHFGRSPRAIVDQVENLLAGFTPDDFVSRAREGQRFADLHFRQDDQLVRILNFDELVIDPIKARSLWEQNSRVLEEL